MKIIETYVNNNPNNFRTAERGKNDIKFVVMHYTGNPGSTASANCKYYRSGNTKGVSAHYFVDVTGVYRCVREKDIAGHCGKWSNTTYLTDCRNDNSIGIELCCQSMSGKKASQLTGRETDLYIEQKTIDNAIELVKDLMERYDIDVNHIIRHYDVHSGRKLCPRPFVGDDINDYYKISGNAKWKEFLSKLDADEEVVLPKVPFKVKVLVPDLNYRSTPSMGNNIVGATGIGTFTIVEIQNGWGKLASGAGWIWLMNPEYCQVVKAPFKVRVKINDLNIRKGPGTNYAKLANPIKPGTYTITEIKTGKGSTQGWGRLKSGIGWISLDFVSLI